MMKTTFVAINAMYQHRSLALQLLHNAVQSLDILHCPLELTINMRSEALFRAVYETKPDVLCFSCYIWNIHLVLQIIKDIKKVLPLVKIVLGGPEVSYDAVFYLDTYPQIDAILCGEGEQSYPKLLAQYANGGDGTGIAGVLLQGMQRVQQPALAPEVSLSQTMDAYLSLSHYDPARIWYAETSRGCPFHCQFCLSSVTPGVRALSAADALVILGAMAQRGAKLVKLVDRTFNFDTKRALAIWQGLLAIPSDCVFHFEIEPSLLDEETLLFLQSVPPGRFQFEIGIQSTNPQTLQHISRRFQEEKVQKSVRRLRSYGNIPLHLDLIAGLPAEDFTSFANSFDTVWGFMPNVLQLGFLKLLRGSGLRERAAAYGIVYQEEAPYEVLQTAVLSQDELLLLKDIDKTVDWYCNSFAYPASMALLLQGAASPFACFQALALSLRHAGYFSASIGQAERLCALYEAGCAFLPYEKHALLADAIRFDAYMQDVRQEKLPPACRDIAFMDTERSYLRKHYASYDERRAYRLARFMLAVDTLITQKQIVSEETILLIHRTSKQYWRVTLAGNTAEE